MLGLGFSGAWVWGLGGLERCWALASWIDNLVCRIVDVTMSRVMAEGFGSQNVGLWVLEVCPRID